jgi:hypothetical protein
LPEAETHDLVLAASEALSEDLSGFSVGFSVTSSFGAVLLPEEAKDAPGALRVADGRLYAQKHSRGLAAIARTKSSSRRSSSAKPTYARTSRES